MKLSTSQSIRAVGIVAALVGSLMAAVVSPTVANASGTWTQQTNAGTGQWSSVASSSDGSKLAATKASGGNIYTSTNSGATWTAQTDSGAGYWTSITSNTDGTKLAAVETWGRIWTSADSGVHWTPKTDVPSTVNGGYGTWRSIASSSDGTKLVAAKSGGGNVYTSSDSGATWTLQSDAGSGNWWAVASNSDGTKLVAAQYGGKLATSTDSGAHWTTQSAAGSGPWWTITSSSDGAKLAAARNGGGIYTSDDSGTTWTLRTSFYSSGWTSITSSNDGTKLAAARSYQTVMISRDSGVTWREQTSAGSGSWTGVASSADGSKLAAVRDSGGSIWTWAAPTGAEFAASTSYIPLTVKGSTSEVMTTNVTNTGATNLVFPDRAVTKSGTNPADYLIVADNCSKHSVAPNGICTVTFKFKPTAGGTRTATLNFRHNASSSPDAVSLSASATGSVAIKSLNIKSGPAAGATELTITGTGFQATANVKFDGVSATVVSRIGTTKITVQSPAHAVSKVLVAVTNPDNGTAAYNGFTYVR